jgi:hypothetical protein
MTKRLTALFLVTVMTGGVLAGMPLHSGEQECSMTAMSGMDCCAAARAQDAVPEASAARLCCAVNCPQSGTTSPGGLVRPVSPLAVTAVHPAAAQLPPRIPGSTLRLDSPQDHPPNSQPTYIRHLALLI